MSPILKRALLLITIVAVALFFNLQAEAQLIQISASHADVDQLSIGDLDFENFGSQHWFFTLTVISNPPIGEARLQVGVDIDLPSGSFPNAVSLLTQPFTVPMTFTNMDLGKNGMIKVEPGTFHFSEDAKDRVKDLALSTGRLPAGTYTFNLKVYGLDNPLIADSTQVIITIRNNSRVELVSPMDRSEVPTAFPLFQWQYDGDRVELSVYEKDPNRHQSNEEALNGTPYLVVKTGDPGLPEGVRTFQYPASGARALEEGKTYVWTVRALQSGSGGSDLGINSEIWEFTVTGSDDLTNNPVKQFNVTEEISEQLQDIHGLDKEALKRLLADSHLTGDVYLNGQKISLAELKQLLDELLANPDRIIEMRVTNE